MSKRIKSFWTSVFLLTIMFLFCPADGKASFITEKNNYRVSLSAANVVRFDIPVYEKVGLDSWIYDGKIYYSVVGGDGSKVEVFQWYVLEKNADIPDSQNWVLTDYIAKTDGLFEVIPGTLNPIGLGGSEPKSKQTRTGENPTDCFSATVLWTVPAELRGKQLRFHWWVDTQENESWSEIRVTHVQALVDVATVDLSVPDGNAPVDPSITEATLMPDSIGKIAVPWFIAAQDLSKVDAVYTDRQGNQVTQSVNPNEGNLVLLNATEPHKDFYLSVDYFDNFRYLISGRKSDPKQDIPMLHPPLNLKATPLMDDKGSVRIDWNIQDTNYPEIMDGDMFEIQRSVTGKEEDFVSIGIDILDLNQENYTFTDSTLLASLTEDDLGYTGSLSNLTYRVRRSCTATWGWENNPAAVSTSLRINQLRCKKVINPKAEWQSEDDRQLLVSWDYLPSDGQYWYVWDERSKMKVRVKLYDRDKNLIETNEYELSQEEIKKKNKVLTLSRPCLYYQFEILVNQGDSPLTNEARTYNVASDSDWRTMMQDLELNDEIAQIFVNLTADIELFHSSSSGDKDRPFVGVIEGNGHSITVHNVIPIPFAKNSTIRNLVIKGEMEQMVEASGLIGDAENVTIENCLCSVNFRNFDQAAAFAFHAKDVRITNALFTGKVDQESRQVSSKPQWFGFIGQKMNDEGMSYITNSVSALDQNSQIVKGDRWGWNFTNEPGKRCTLENVYYIGESWGDPYSHEYDLEIQGKSLEGDQEEWLKLLGDGWQGSTQWPAVVPVMQPQEYSNDVVTVVNNPDFYFENSGKLDKKLMTETRQSSVLLTWNTDGGVVDYFQVLRRPKGMYDFDIIAPQVDNLNYEDTTVSPLAQYEYKVRAAVDCEGLHFTETDVEIGFCKNTGIVEGVVKFPDGTGVPGITVNIKNGDNLYTAVTDENGHFVKDELPYGGASSITYTVSPVSRDKMEFSTSEYNAEFNAKTNSVVLDDFVIKNGIKFSGFVMYEGTSIPVHGAHFMVNQKELKNANGNPVETDFEGKFSFYVKEGDNVIQACMDGHTFTEDGYYKSKDGVHITEPVTKIYFYDSTRVKLIGRVVGGDTQGSLPLGNNLSKNNLGENARMVLTLEGDNTSWLVYNNLNTEQSTRDEVFYHDAKHQFMTKVHTTRKRIEVAPDSITGEYEILLPPVRWKVMQVFCEGYPSLFQDGMVSEVIDLTDCVKEKTETVYGTFVDAKGNTVRNPVTTYNAKYNRIYHAPLEITYKQRGYDNFSYLGDKTYIAQALDGTSTEVPLAYADATAEGGVGYTFQYPVFSINRQYPIELAAVERYYWNNHASTDTIDVVKIGGGKVTVQNGFINGTHKEVVQLNDEGEGIYYLKSEQMPYLLTGKDALRTVTMTLEQDGTKYEAKPIKGYIFNLFATQAGTDILSQGQPLLVDILRDPPGGGSTATLSNGSVLKYSYTLDMSYAAGIELDYTTGTSLTNYTGIVAAPAGEGTSYGTIQQSDIESLINFQVKLNGEGHRAFSYEMNLNQDITTSSNMFMVGADADLYIGMVQNITVTPSSAIRAIPDETFQKMVAKLPGGKLPTGGEVKYGSMVEIASGVGKDGKKYHLVRDEVLAYGPKIQSTFVHSQKHILTQIIPQLVQQCRDLMFIGTPQEAQMKANSTGKAVYLSLVQPDDSLFAVMNTKNGSPYYYSSRMPDEPGMGYRIYLPEGSDKDFQDEVQAYSQSVLAWIAMIAENEMEKLSAIEFVKNYDVDGGSNISYSETFTSEYSIGSYMHFPGLVGGKYFDNDIGDKALAFGSIIAVPIANYFIGKLWDKISKTPTATGKSTDENNKGEFNFKVVFLGKAFKFSILPVLEYDCKDISTEQKTYTRKESFNISMNDKSHLDFDVYRATTRPDATQIKNLSPLDVYTSENFYNMSDMVDDYLSRSMDLSNFIYSKGFVYRTRGGATARPWEDERKTLVYRQGSTLDARTKKIENPKVMLDKQSVSGVPMGEPAKFQLYLTNESEMPDAATGALAFFNLYLDETTNAKGLKVYMDGMPLTGAGRNIRVEPGKVTQKTLEVYAGDDFDYEGVVIGLMSTEDFENAWDEVAFDVHYLKAAGAVNISSPGDKWVMNTDAQFNKKRGWYLPVTIDGFNKHQKNFDHIEFQYKESSRGDEYWTNLCSFYADSTLMANANGVTAMIPQNDNIKTEFYGEGTVMEKAYDLRAVLFCRNGNTFLTNSSKVLSGIKDTRRPVLFGSPEPADGIIDFGDHIVFNFSEDIEYNYLSEITNFEVKGEVNNDNVKDDVSLLFSGNSSLETEAVRNFSGKDFTIDIMIKPDDNGKEMPIFSHGTGGKKFQIWITDKKKIKVVSDSQTFVSDSVINVTKFSEISVAVHLPDSVGASPTLTMYDGGVVIGQAKMENPYNGSGPLIFGRTNDSNRRRSTFFEGKMMEARLWYRALDGALITQYGQKRLSGYEMGLMDYYPMNEGNGDYASDKSQGAHARLYDATWAMPKGMALHLTPENKGLALASNVLSRTAEQDYTLMFWFRNSNANGVLVSNGDGAGNFDGAENRFCIEFVDRQLLYKSNGFQAKVPGSYTDNDWHQYVMTVNRAMNVVNIYVDNTLRTTFPADTLGAMSGGYPRLGAAVREYKSDGITKTADTAGYLNGYIDEFCVFEQALPLSLINNYFTRSPKGDEAGLITYISFDIQKRQKDNSIMMEPYAYSRKIYLDDNGNVRYVVDPLTKENTSEVVRTYPFADDVTEEMVLSLIDKDNSAPVMPYEELRNIDFSFVGKDNQILININEPTSRVNKRNVYVTLREIPDKNGNTIVSPVTAAFYIDSSPLKWLENRIQTTVPDGIDLGITLNVCNNTSAKHTYTIENVPEWLELDYYTNIIGPNDVASINGKINPNLNVGTYDEIIYLKDENGVYEPLYLTVTIEGAEPEWQVAGDMLQNSMNIVGIVYINDEIDIDSRDIVGVFDKNNQCHGYAHISYSQIDGESRVYLTVYDNKSSGTELFFKLWRYTTGKEMMLSVNPAITFKTSEMLGTVEPVVFRTNNAFVQTFHLKKGWNWVSFNVYSDKFRDLNTLLDGLPWVNEDMLVDMTNNISLIYTDEHWRVSGDIQKMRISPKYCYAVKVSEDIDFPIAGNIIQQAADRTIEVHQGWNYIGYTPIVNLDVETALSYYHDFAQHGDVIKSQTGFSVYTVTNGVGRWKGDLQYLKPGEGYMLFRKDSSTAKFIYPLYEPGSAFVQQMAKAPEFDVHSYATTMSVSARTTGIALRGGDKLKAFVDGELRGTAQADEDDIFYLSVSGDQEKPVWFAIERDGDIIATTREIAAFKANAIIGTPDMPTTIDFTTVEPDQQGWYTLSGIKLNGKPDRKGIYIYNGKKYIIK